MIEKVPENIHSSL